MEEERISYHESVRRMYKKIKSDGLTNVWDRYEAQGTKDNPDQRCPFCMNGVRCDLCSNGPCRADVEKDKRGVCGITGDGMAMRMMLLRNVLGASTYHYHTEETLRTFKAAMQGYSLFKIREPDKLRAFALRFNIPDILSDEDISSNLYTHFTSDFSRSHHEFSYIVQTLAPKERIEKWKELGIFPGGIYGELLLSTSSCLTNVDGYYLSLAKKALRLSIAMAYQSQLVNEYLQDILFGTPRPHKMRVDLGVLDPDYVNVLPNGHEPFLGFAMIELARRKEWQEKAKKMGAKGLRIIGSIETGQEIIQRYEMDDVFYGFTGNWLSQEAVLASGCIDLFACDMNCSMPIDPIYSKRYRFKLVPVTSLVSFEGIEERIDYSPYEVESQAATLLEMAIENFPERRKNVEPTIDLPTREAIVGFSAESILDKIGGTPEPLIKAILDGKIKGIAALVSCTTLRDSGQDVHTIRMADELIKNDVIVLSMGCGNAALQVAGYCTEEAKKIAGEGLRSICDYFGIPPVLSFGTCTDVGRVADFLGAISAYLKNLPIPELPVVVCAPEYMEQKATIDAIFSLALGLYTYVNPHPPIGGAPNLIRLLVSELPQITGGKLDLERDHKKAIEGMLKHLSEKRMKMGAKA